MTQDKYERAEQIQSNIDSIICKRALSDMYWKQLPTMEKILESGEQPQSVVECDTDIYLKNIKEMMYTLLLDEPEIGLEVVDSMLKSIKDKLDKKMANLQSEFESL